MKIIHKLRKKNQAGFSLIELLIVIGIIGILAAYIVINNNRSKIQSRDARRLSDIREIFNSLQVFYTDTESFPPDCSDPGYSGGCDGIDIPEVGINSDTSLDGDFVSFLSPTYLGTIPKDPLNTGTLHYDYFTNVEYPAGSGDFYLFLVGATLEDGTNSQGGIVNAALPDYYVLGEKQ
ncbi:MAG TPA: prepilin-type N-terminal cleavage/methylation domain-containing protein [Candidatus Binatia bacterium]|nr:prepilin-type N-terminal cleavage/methylation domain-containing protein [Candidatus Binatia bacterium]